MASNSINDEINKIIINYVDPEKVTDNQGIYIKSPFSRFACFFHDYIVMRLAKDKDYLNLEAMTLAESQRLADTMGCVHGVPDIIGQAELNGKLTTFFFEVKILWSAGEKDNLGNYLNSRKRWINSKFRGVPIIPIFWCIINERINLNGFECENFLGKDLECETYQWDMLFIDDVTKKAQEMLDQYLTVLKAHGFSISDMLGQMEMEDQSISKEMIDFLGIKEQKVSDEVVKLESEVELSLLRICGSNVVNLKKSELKLKEIPYCHPINSKFAGPIPLFLSYKKVTGNSDKEIWIEIRNYLRECQIKEIAKGTNWLTRLEFNHSTKVFDSIIKSHVEEEIDCNFVSELLQQDFDVNVNSNKSMASKRFKSILGVGLKEQKQSYHWKAEIHSKGNENKLILRGKGHKHVFEEEYGGELSYGNLDDFYMENHEPKEAGMKSDNDGNFWLETLFHNLRKRASHQFKLDDDMPEYNQIDSLATEDAKFLLTDVCHSNLGVLLSCYGATFQKLNKRWAVNSKRDAVRTMISFSWEKENCGEKIPVCAGWIQKAPHFGAKISQPVQLLVCVFVPEKTNLDGFEHWTKFEVLDTKGRSFLLMLKRHGMTLQKVNFFSRIRNVLIPGLDALSKVLDLLRTGRSDNKKHIFVSNLGKEELNVQQYLTVISVNQFLCSLFASSQLSAFQAEMRRMINAKCMVKKGHCAIFLTKRLTNCTSKANDAIINNALVLLQAKWWNLSLEY